MIQASWPSHLPSPSANRAVFQRVYESDMGMDTFLPDDRVRWQEIRIPSNLSAREVYRRLPSATDFEYGGYLTKTRIRYVAFGPRSSHTLSSKGCTFHTHPASHPHADIASHRDVYHFLKWRFQRAITVGNHWIWVWEKNLKTLATVRRLLAWEKQNMMAAINRVCMKECEDFFREYFCIALKALGLPNVLRHGARPDVWSRALQETLAIKTVFLRREA